MPNDCLECHEDGTLIGDVDAKTCHYKDTNIRYCIKV